MRWIAAAGVATVCFFCLAGAASGASLIPVAPSSYYGSDPSFLTGPPDDRRVFIAERGNPGSNQAQIRIVKDGNPLATPFLTIGNVARSSERGLMSIAFSPDYPANGLFYAFYTAQGPDSLDPAGVPGDIRIIEYRVSSGDPDLADPGSARMVLKVPHSAGNHNGGWMEFGPDGKLYLSIGDNANAANAQTPGNLLGKILRIDPADPDGAGSATYSVPADNPFVSSAGYRGEIWTLGLRNPYRASFAPDGRLTIGDVGEGTWEEVNAGDLKGKNLGWAACEGFCSPFNPSYMDPVYTYGHSGGNCAVTGGHVVEDPDLTGLTGRYLFSDFCTGPVRSLNLDVPGADPQVTTLNTFGNVVSFGQDEPGCSYVLNQNEVFRIGATSGAGVNCPMPLDPAVPLLPGPEPPIQPPDVSYTSFIPKRAKAGMRLTVGAACSISCVASATATYRITRNRYRRKPVKFTPARVTVNVQPGQRGELNFRINRKRARWVKKAMRNGSRATVFVKVSMTGADGSGGSGSRRLRLIRP